jgi:penicillin G amidase
MRWLRRLLLLALLLAAAAFGTGWYLLAGSRAQLEGQVAVAGLEHPVTIRRDRDGVATFEAANRTDLAYALGYVHAQERFFEMDLMRRVAAGELAALVGPAALDLDLDHRRHRFRALARAAVTRLPAERRALLDAYTAGVDAGLAHLRVRPCAYLLLRARPKPWRDEDTLLVVEAMFFDLNGGGDDHRELEIEHMRAALPPRLIDFLLARDGCWEAPLQGQSAAPASVPSPDIFDLRREPRVAERGFRLASPALPGSNNFAVAGALTGAGAVVANDMHLGLRVPNIWYRARLRYRDDGHRVDLDGLILPGTPLLIAGSNGHIAWGYTNSYGDWMDWVRVRLDPHDPKLYRVPGGWAELQVHRETIRVKGGKPQTLTVRDTRWGPIMARDNDGTPLALAWIAQLPRVLNLNLVELEHVDSVHEALVVAPTLGMPPQNFIVGDADGHIGWTLTGNALPLRAGYDPSRPADWSQQGTGWIGFASPLQYPRLEDPADGRLWSANNRTTSGAWLALEGDGGYELGARAQQIRDDLRARDHFVPADMLAIQLDDRALFLARWQGMLARTLAAHPDPGLAELHRLTAKPPARAGIDSVDYRLVRAFRTQVTRRALVPFAARVKARFPHFVWPRNSEAAVWAMVTQRPPNLLDPKYPTWDALLLDAAHAVVSDLAKQPRGLAAQTWGKRNVAAIRHPLAAALPAFLGRWLNMPRDELPGDHDMPRVQSPSFGASERFAIMPGHEERSYLHMPGGQTDNPLSPYYGAGHEAWVQGRATPLLPGPTHYRLTLRPVTEAR